MDFHDITFIDYGKEQCLKGKDNKFFPRDYHLFHYVMSGNGYFILEEKEYYLKAGDIFYIPKHYESKYYPSSIKPWNYFWLGIDGEIISSIISKIGINSLDPIIHDQNFKVKKIVEEIIDSNYETQSLGMKGLAYLFLNALDELNNSLTNKKEKIYKNNYIKQAKEFILNNYYYKITISEVAKSLGINVNYLANVFHRFEEISPKEYLTKIRMEKAKELLLDNKSIKKTSFEVGYSSEFYFSTAFKKFYKCSPREFIQRGGNVNENGQSGY